MNTLVIVQLFACLFAVMAQDLSGGKPVDPDDDEKSTQSTTSFKWPPQAELGGPGHAPIDPAFPPRPARQAVDPPGLEGRSSSSTRSVPPVDPQDERSSGKPTSTYAPVPRWRRQAGFNVPPVVVPGGKPGDDDDDLFKKSTQSSTTDRD